MWYGMGDEERDWGEYEAVWECRGGEERADRGGTKLGLQSEDYVKGQEEGDKVNVEEEAFGTYAMDYGVV